MDLVGPYLILPFLVLLVIGVPIAFSLGFSVVVFTLFSGTRIPILAVLTEMYDGVSIAALLALPLFILAGEVLTRGFITQRLVDVANVSVGWVRGGLGHVTVVASMFFAGISGSAIADTASIGPILIPAMIRDNFPRAYSAAITAASSVIGPIIPPSIPMIIVGAQLGISIGGLFAAGIIPGLLIGFGLLAVNYAICRWKGYGKIHPFPGITSAIATTVKASPALLIPFLMLGGILSGIFTPTEAGGVAAAYAILLGLFWYRELTPQRLWDSMLATARVTGSVVLIFATAVIFSRILVFYQLPEMTLKFLLSITTERVALILLVVALFLLVGMFMDAVVNMIILGPLLMPIFVNGLGFHPIQYGIFLVVGLLLGLITPPVGLCLFIAAPIARERLDRVALAALPFLAMELLILLLIAFVPGVTLWIPRMLNFS